MELKINRDEFLKGVSLAQSVTITKGTMPILSHLLLEAKDDRIYVFGTDLELGMKGEAKAHIIEEGSICLSAKMMADILREKLDELSDKHRTILVLREFEGLSYNEIAEVLGCSKGTVESRLFRARNRLREKLEKFL